ncbi:MAG: hypothetical protein AAB573_00890 [Patescibacteria group bacterium]
MALEKLGALALATMALTATQDVDKTRARCIQVNEIREVAEGMYAEACRKTTVKNGGPVVTLIKSRECDNLGDLVERTRRFEKKNCTKPVEAKNQQH